MRFPLKTALVAAFFMTLPTVLAAQASLGFRGGLSFAGVSGTDTEDLGTTQGVNVGAFVNVPLSDAGSLQIGAGFVQKGAELTEGSTTAKIGIDYVEIPLLLKLSSQSTGSLGLSLFVGPVFSFKAGCTVSGSALGVEADLDCDDPEADLELTSHDVGAMVGVGLDLAVSDAASLLLQGFYNRGVTSIDDSGDGEEAKSRAFSVLAGLSFALGG